MLIRLPPDLHDGLTRLRTERHINISAWVRSLITRELDCELGPDRDPPIPLSPPPPPRPAPPPPPGQRGQGLHLSRRSCCVAL